MVYDHQASELKQPYTPGNNTHRTAIHRVIIMYNIHTYSLSFIHVFTKSVIIHPHIIKLRMLAVSRHKEEN